MRALGTDIKANVAEIVQEWEILVREQPWFALPAEHRTTGLPEVIIALVEASLCEPSDVESHRRIVQAAAQHGWNRRTQSIPEGLLLTEYHLLRQALWRYLTRKFGPSHRTVEAITRMDTAITVATNASLWGYYREEIEALGKWDASVETLALSSPLLKSSRPDA